MANETTITISTEQSEATTDTNPHDFPARARELTQQVREGADQAAAAGTLPAHVVALLEAAGMFRMALPRGLGGFQVDPVTLVRTAEELAYADGSTAWTVMTGNSSMFFAWLDQGVAAGLLNGRAGQPVSSSFAPTGRGVEEDGGYRVSGRWSYVSGAPHAAMILVGFIVVDRGGAPQSIHGRPVMRWAVLPATDVQVLPTWNDAAGLRGSGSHDVVAEDVFVATERTLMPLFERPEAGGALYRMPFFTGVRSLLMGVPLGAARRALDELNKLCRNKSREMVPLIDDQDVQIRLAEAEATLRAGRSFVLELTERTWAAVQDRDALPLDLRTDYTLAAQFAMRSAVKAVDLAFEVAGVSSALSGNAIQRCWRDVNVASQHIAFSRNRWRGAGQALLGLEIDPLYL